MFTGLVEELGTVRAVIPNASGARLEIEATTVLDDAELGASIAVNGCCLTAGGRPTPWRRHCAGPASAPWRPATG
jgi:riboflavin synthase